MNKLLNCEMKCYTSPSSIIPLLIYNFLANEVDIIFTILTLKEVLNYTFKLF